MSDMQINQLPIYFKLAEAVKKNDAQKVAELVYEHTFLSKELERPLPEMDLTPYMFAIQNESTAELVKILVAFGAKTKVTKSEPYEITPYQEIPPTQLFYSSLSVKSLDIKLTSIMPEKSLVEQKTDIIKKYHLDTIEKLYILTGFRPFHCDRTLHKNGTQGTHLRLMMPHVEKAQVEMLLQIFNIPFNDGFGSRTHSYISILPNNYGAIDSYFNNLDFDKKSPNLFIDNLPPENKIALCNILYSPKFIAGLEERNANQYSLNSIMLFLVKFNMKHSLCFEYLEEQGYSFKHKIASKNFLPMLEQQTNTTNQNHKLSVLERDQETFSKIGLG